MNPTVEPRSATHRTQSLRGNGWKLILALVLFVVAALWAAQGPLLRALLRATIPAAARSAGYDLKFDILQARFFAPVVLGNVRTRGTAGDSLRAARVELAFATAADLVLDSRRIIHRISIRGLSGGIRVGDTGSSPAAAGADASAWWPSIALPPVVEIEAENFFFSNGDRHLFFKDVELRLNEDAMGRLRVGEAGFWAGSWSKKFGALHSVTAWRDGIAYFSGLTLEEGVVMDSLAVDFHKTPSFTLRGRAFEGSIYIDWSGGLRTSAALNAHEISLGQLGRFLGLQQPLRGQLDTLKWTFRGTTEAPLDAQSFLRVEATDFSYDRRMFSSLRLGASLSGRNLKIDECKLEQKGNSISAGGSVAIPAEASGWRSADVNLGVDATVKNMRALADLFGSPWNRISGGMTLGARVEGSMGRPTGWIRARGWDLRVPGIPASSLQADITMQGGTIRIAGLESHSGPDFLRASGEASLREPLSYRGQLEARVREMSRYLEPLGRFAPDWASQGGVLVFWDGDGADDNHSGVVSLELFDFTGDMNPVPVSGKIAATYSPGNVYVSRFLLNRGSLSLSATGYLSAKGLSVEDIQMFNMRQRLLRGEFFLPVSFPLLLEGRAWREAMLPGGKVYANIRSDDLRLDRVANLFGQAAPVGGSVDWKLDASGSWENPALESSLIIEGFRTRLDSFAIPPSRLSGKATLAQQRLEFNGQLDIGRSEPAVLTASIPLLARNQDGGWRILDRDNPVSANFSLPKTDLSFFAADKPLAGLLAGSLVLSGTLSAPQLSGALDWSNVTHVIVDGLLPVTKCSGHLFFEGTTARLEGVQGLMGEGHFAMEGKGDFSNPSQISASFEFDGKGLGFMRSGGMSVMGHAKIIGRREGDARNITGEVALVNSEVSAVLSAMPLILPTGVATAPVSFPLPFAANGLLAEWQSDLHIFSSEPVGLGHGASANADVRLTGLASHPVPVGTIDCTGLQASLPSGSLAFSRARFHFTPDMPGTPILDLEGTAHARGYKISATAWGPLGKQQMNLSSVPELSPEQIVLLLSAGLPPESDVRSGQFLPAEPSAPPQPELPPSRIGYSWELH